MGDLGDAVGERRGGDRRHRVDPVGGQLDPRHDPDRQSSQKQADDDPDGDLQGDQADHVDGAVVRLLDPFDEADDEQQGDRVVHPGLALERACQALLQGRVAQHGEDRGGVGGGDRGADDHPFQPGEAEDHFAATPARSAVASVPTVASEAAVPSTGRISDQPEVSPPSKRIRTSAIVPSVRARS